MEHKLVIEIIDNDGKIVVQVCFNQMKTLQLQCMNEDYHWFHDLCGATAGSQLATKWIQSELLAQTVSSVFLNFKLIDCIYY